MTISSSVPDNKIVEYRGWKIEQVFAPQYAGKHTAGGYVSYGKTDPKPKLRTLYFIIHYPASEGGGATKTVKSLTAAKQYINDYNGWTS